MVEHSITKPKILMIGTGHWANPGLDLAGMKYDDMLAPGRQAQIADLIDRLKKFGPTKVAVEVEYERTSVMNERYAGYKSGTFELTANEVYQVGFKLAEAMGHESIYCIDAEGTGDWEGVFTYAEAHNQSNTINADLQHIQEKMANLSARVADMTLLKLLRESNDLLLSKKEHELYTDLAVIGENNEYPGAQLVAAWYERNIKMYANITRITTQPNDRIFVIVGSGHLPYIKHFLENSGRYDLEDAEQYLED